MSMQLPMAHGVAAPSDGPIAPVCGMRVVPDEPHQYEHGGVRYHFCCTAVRLEFPILSLNPGLRQRGVAPDVWGRRVAGGGRPDGRGARHRRRCTGCPSGARARGAPALAALERRRAHPRP